MKLVHGKYSMKFVRFDVVIFVVLSVILILVQCLEKRKSHVAEETAKAVVMDLYDFSSTKQLEINKIDLRRRVTEPVYNQLIIDNDERRLNTYLKFRAESSSVKFIKVTDQYVVYSLDCIYVEKDRKFLFLYKMDNYGKLSSVYEAELNPFIVGDYEWE